MGNKRRTDMKLVNMDTLNRQGGFTLIELIVVIVMIGIFALTAIPRFMDLSDDARLASLKSIHGSIKEVMRNIDAVSAIESRVTYDSNEQNKYVTYSDGVALLMMKQGSSSNFHLSRYEICRSIDLIDETLSGTSNRKRSKDGKYECYSENFDNLVITDVNDNNYCIVFDEADTGTIYTDGTLCELTN